MPERWDTITTPLKAEVWEEGLASYPDKVYAGFIMRGIIWGFRIGFNYRQQLSEAKYNLLSAEQNPKVVDEYLSEEIGKDRITEIKQEEGPIVQASAIGVIPKKHKLGKWRLIVDLSAPANWSVNDSIEKELCSVSYISIDTIVKQINLQGRGTQLAKLDVKQAYRMVPVHPMDRLLLAMKWRGKTFIDKALPFGLRAAPLIFTAIADALQFMMEARGANPVFHYLDDFVTLGEPGSRQCSSNFHIMQQTCHDAEVPVEDGKTEGPSTTISFLGMELDTITMEIRLPADKLQCLQKLT